MSRNVNKAERERDRREVDGVKNRQPAGLRGGGRTETGALCCHQDISYITVTLNRPGFAVP